VRTIRFTCFLAFLCAAAAASASAPVSWEALEAEGAVLDRIEIEVVDVFDLRNPDEDHLLGKAANALHIVTREETVRREMLFEAGKPIRARRIRETERNLRAYDYIREASIRPVRAKDGSLTARVTVQDAWSLRGGVNFHHAGGDSEWSIRLHEVNLLGRGKKLQLSYEKNRERSTKKVAYLDPRLFGSRWQMEANYQDLSDGRLRLFKLERPFYSLDARWSAGVFARRDESILTLYNLDEEALSFPARIDEVALPLRYTYRLRGNTAFRIGLEARSSQARYGPVFVEREGLLPLLAFEDRRLRGIFLHWGVAQDRFETFENIMVMGRTEDVNLGWDLDVGLGWVHSSFGEASDAPVGELDLEKAWRLGSSNLLALSSWVQARREGGAFRDSWTSTRLTLYHVSLPRQTLAASAAVDGGTRLAPENWLYLGAADGMRGYANRVLAGDRRWTVSIEDRIITSKTLWGIAQVGFVAYADAGAIRRFDTGRWSRTYADAGLGLRFGNLKSSFGKVFSLTIAFPLVRDPGMDSYQIVFGNTFRF